MRDMGMVFVTGIIAIGLVTAFGLHSAGLAQVGKTGFTGAQGLLNTAEKG